MFNNIDFSKEEYNNFLNYLLSKEIVITDVNSDLYLSIDEKKDNKTQISFNVEGNNIVWVLERNVIDYCESLFINDFKEFSHLWLNYKKINKSYYFENHEIVLGSDIELENIGEPYHIEYLKKLLEKIELKASPKLFDEKYNLNFKELLFLQIWNNETMFKNNFQEWKELYINWLDMVKDKDSINKLEDINIMNIFQYHNIPSILSKDSLIKEKIASLGSNSIFNYNVSSQNILEEKSIVDDGDKYYCKYNFNINTLKDYFSPKIFQYLMFEADILASVHNKIEIIDIETNPMLKILTEIAGVLELEVFNKKNKIENKGFLKIDDNSNWWIWIKVDKDKFSDDFLILFKERLEVIAPIINSFSNIDELKDFAKGENIRNKIDSIMLLKEIKLNEKKAKKVKY